MMFKILTTTYRFLLLAGLFFASHTAFAQHPDPEQGKHEHKEGEHKHEKKFSPAETIMHHVLDSHEWEFMKIGETHITIPLPIILYTEKGLDIFLSSELHHAKDGSYEKDGKHIHAVHLKRGDIEYVLEDHLKFHVKGGGFLYDFSITKNIASMLIGVSIMLFVFISVANSYKKNAGKAPRGMQSFFEPLIVFVRDDIAKENIGEKKYERFLPYLLTIFFFIWFNNLLGLFPGGANLTGNISVTLCLATLTFLITNLSGNKGYWGHIFAPPGVPLPLMPLIVVIEIIGIFTKPFALTVRLFANITAGHIIILSLLSLIFIFQSMVVGVVSSAFAIALMFLELLVALLQAYIFTLLSAMYIGSAVAEHHHEHDEEHDHDHKHAHAH
jgi:F-type H+-transporting ATPase subunit a